MTSRQVAMLVYSAPEVLIAERLRLFHQFLGDAFENVYAEEVAGSVGRLGEADVKTPLGEFEFCTQHNTKNAAGEAAHRATGRRVVQVLEDPVKGRLSAIEFLELHGVRKAAKVNERLIATAAAQAKQRADETVLKGMP